MDLSTILDHHRQPSWVEANSMTDLLAHTYGVEIHAEEFLASSDGVVDRVEYEGRLLDKVSLSYKTRELTKYDSETRLASCSLSGRNFRPKDRTDGGNHTRLMGYQTLTSFQREHQDPR